MDAEIMAFLEGEEEDDEVEEELVDAVIRNLERDIFFSAENKNPGKLSAPGTSSGENGCYLQSDSAFSLTSTSVRISDESVIGSRCGCLKIPTSEEELGYIMEASDEELGLLPPPSTVCSEFDMDVIEKEWFQVDGDESFGCYVDGDADLEKLLG